MMYNRNQQALVALSNGHHAEAIALLTKAIFLHPLDPSYYFHRAEAYLQILDFESCLANYEHFAGLLQKQVSDRQAAFRNYKKAYPVLKRWPAILYTWAQILLDQKRYTDVIGALDKAEKLGIPRTSCLLRRYLLFFKKKTAYKR